MTPHRRIHKLKRPMRSRDGFTLIEMLISVGLVVLMMSLFASIFQMASGSISTQRAIAENDQRARALVMLLRGDLDKRTFRNMIPYLPGEDPNDSPIRFGDRQGYFFVSEGLAASDTDDSVQFTVRSTITRSNRDETPYYGRATLLVPSDEAALGRQRAFGRNPNQPEADDADIRENGTAISTVAQVCYFLRETNLYRRVVLVREPLALAEGDAQPRRGSNGDDFFEYAKNLYRGNFYSDFDFSAVPDSSASPSNAQFVGIKELSNESGGLSLGRAQNRFGHHFSGFPVEYINEAGKTTYFGRFTHGETSSSFFAYPFGLFANRSNDPYVRANANLTVTDGVVSQYSNGTRKSEDLVLSNVHSFDVELWDESRGGFVDLGGATGDLGPRVNNLSYGPLKGRAATDGLPCFDTWHPDSRIPNRAIPDPYTLAGDVNKFPPYAPVYYTPTTAPDGVYDDTMRAEYSVGDIVVPVDPTGIPTVYYQCIGIPSGTNTGFTAPSNLPDQPGQTYIDGNVEWRVHLNRKAIKAIRITIRFIDDASNAFRQVSIVHSLTN